MPREIDTDLRQVKEENHNTIKARKAPKANCSACFGEIRGDHMSLEDRYGAYYTFCSDCMIQSFMWRTTGQI
jgi:hypothetical protein